MLELTHERRFVGLARYRWRLFGAFVVFATLGTIIVWGKYESLRPLVGAVAGAGAIAQGLFFLSLYPLTVGRNARAAPWKVGQVFRPGPLIFYGYTFVALGVFVTVGGLISWVLDILS